MYHKKKHVVLKPTVDSQQAYIKIVIMTLAVRLINLEPLTKFVGNGALFSVKSLEPKFGAHKGHIE